MDAYVYSSSCLNVICLVSFNSFTTFKDAGLSESELLNTLNQLNSFSHVVIPTFSLCLYGLQQRFKAKEFRNNLRYVCSFFLLTLVFAP